MIASWALGGLHLSLGPSVTAGLFGPRNHLIGGVVEVGVGHVEPVAVEQYHAGAVNEIDGRRQPVQGRGTVGDLLPGVVEPGDPPRAQHRQLASRVT
jgi:hypothetical protein